MQKCTEKDLEMLISQTENQKQQVFIQNDTEVT